MKKLEIERAPVEVLAQFRIPPTEGCMDASLVLMEIRGPNGDLTKFVTAQHNDGKQSWYWGHYFDVTATQGVHSAYVLAVHDFMTRIGAHAPLPSRFKREG